MHDLELQIKIAEINRELIQSLREKTAEMDAEEREAFINKLRKRGIREEILEMI